MLKNWKMEHLWLYRMLSFVVVCVLMVVFVMACTHWLYRDITLVTSQGEEVEAVTTAATVGEYLDLNQVAVSPEDQVLPGLDVPLADGMTITINKAFQVKVTADGNEESFTTLPLTVADALTQAGVTLDELDEVTPAPETRLTADTDIRVVRVDVKEWVEKSIVKASEVRQEDANMFEGRSRVISRGQDGLTENVWKVVYRDGVETDRQLIASRDVQKPVSRVVAYGTREYAPVVGGDFSSAQAMSVTATAYVQGGTTASGRPAKPGVIAVDPKVIPLGTKVYVEGYGYAIAADTGGKIKNNRIDVCLPTESECIQWGVKRVNLYIVE